MKELNVLGLFRREEDPFHHRSFKAHVLLQTFLSRLQTGIAP